MEISKDHIVAGAIGGVMTLTGAILLKKLLFRGRGGKGLQVTTMTSSNLAGPIGPYTLGRQISCCGKSLGFVSGQIGMDKAGNLVSQEVEGQTEQAMKNLQTAALDNGFKLSEAVKCTLYLVNMDDFAKVNEIYKKYFEGPDYPARVCVAVHQLPKMAKFEIEATFFRNASAIAAVKKVVEEEKKASLYERLGGEGAINAVVDGMYKGIFNDPELIDFFEKTDHAKQIEMQKEFLKYAFGGPTPYTGKDMKSAHKGRGITEKEFNLVAGHVVQSMKNLSVPPELVSEVVGQLVALKDEVIG